MKAKISNEDEATLRRYYRDMATCQPLARQREGELSIRIQQGDQGARDELVRANLRFVVEIAKGYRRRGLTLGELISAGNLGMLKAAERFDGGRGCKFISYGVWWVRQEILNAIANEGRSVRLPMNRINQLKDIGVVRSRLERGREDVPDLDEIAAELKVPVGQLQDTLLCNGAVHSLDADFQGDLPVLEMLADQHQPAPDEAVEAEAGARKLGAALAQLSERERYIVCSYFGLRGEPPLTLATIGRELGVTRERVRQLKERALAKLRRPQHELTG
ncbi:MAG: sigma-70 family RNA polymerase sigma factor [Candidatus Latescibacteria bacterium]|nr:sigma-70 family RNA polymerase sigma factor [Candidatus Latescibacterota bacterium]